MKIENELRHDWQKKLTGAEVLYLDNPLSTKKIEVYVFHYGINRAYGFSDTGKSLVIGTSSDLMLWNRDQIRTNT